MPGSLVNSTISIIDLEVRYRVGVPDKERAKPQRLLLSIDMIVDFSRAADKDRLEDTINYQAVVDDLLSFGRNRSWKLIEKVAADIADRLISAYKPQSVRVQVKKFVIPQARYVMVALTRER